MNFHHLSLTRKLTIAFSILVAIIIGVSTLSVVSLSESQRDFDSFVSDEFSRAGLARDVSDHGFLLVVMPVVARKPAVYTSPRPEKPGAYKTYSETSP